MNHFSVVFLEPKGTILEVVRAAKSRGYRIVAICTDRTLLDGAPAPYDTAVHLIDELVQTPSWLDLQKLESVCEEIHARNPIVGVYGGMDPCAVPLATLRMRFGLPTHSPSSLEVVLNKSELRKRLRELGLSKLQNWHSTEVQTWTDWIASGAAYFKPVHGFFSAYVRRCESLEDLRVAQQQWSEGNPNDPAYVNAYLRSKDEYHVEEAIEGELLSVEAIVSGGKFHVLGLLSRILYSKNAVVEMGSCFPYPHRDTSRIIALVEAAHRGLELTDGPTHTEVIVSPSGQVEIIDLNPRFVGADVLQSINYALHTRIEDTLLDYAIGKKIELSVEAKNYSCLQYFLPPSIPVLGAVDFPDHLEVPFKTTFIKRGTEIQDTERQLDYLGCYLTVMPTFESAIERSHSLRAEVRVNDRYQGVF